MRTWLRTVHKITRIRCINGISHFTYLGDMSAEVGSRVIKQFTFLPIRPATEKLSP